MSVDGGEPYYTTEIIGKVGDTVELNTAYDPQYGCTVFIGWYMEDYGPNGLEYRVIAESQAFTYEITGEESGFLYAVWTEGENPFVKQYVDIRITNGFVSYVGGEGGDLEGGAAENAYSAISISVMGRVAFCDDPTDETVYTAWDVAYRYELEGEVQHDLAESYEDEYGYYPAEYWVNDPQNNYPDGEINVTGIVPTSGEPEGGVERAER